MQKRKSHILGAGIILFTACVSVIIGILILFDDKKQEYYELYFLIPFSYLFFLICVSLRYDLLLRSFSVTLLAGLYFIKYAVTPLLMYLGDYATLLSNPDAFPHMDEAILLSSYEMACIGVAFALAVKKYMPKRGGALPTEEIKRRYDVFDLAIACGAGLILLILVTNPTLKQNFHLAMEIGEAQDPVIELRSWRTIGSGSKVPLGLVNTFLMAIFPMIQIAIPVILMEKIWRRWGKSHRKKAFFLSIAVVGASALILTEANAITVFVVLALLMLTLKLYPDVGRKYAIFILPLFFSVIVLLFASKVRGSSGAHFESSVFSNLSKVMNAYFNGPVNLSVVFLIKGGYDRWISITETLAELPFLSNLFTSYQSSRLFNAAFWGKEGITDQLLPASGQGLLYFGYVLAPLFSCLFVILAVRAEAAGDKCKNIKVKGLLYFAGVICIFLIGNNASHFLSYIRIYILLLFLLPLKKIRVAWSSRVSPLPGRGARGWTDGRTTKFE